MRPILLVASVVLAAACNRQEPKPALGDAVHGKQLITEYGCTACHVVPGIEGPRGEVGPSLAHVATREVLASGKLANNPQNLIQYLQNPQMASPLNVMPNLGVKPEEARDIAAYLYTLK